LERARPNQGSGPATVWLSSLIWPYDWLPYEATGQSVALESPGSVSLHWPSEIETCPKFGAAAHSTKRGCAGLRKVLFLQHDGSRLPFVARRLDPMMTMVSFSGHGSGRLDGSRRQGRLRVLLSLISSPPGLLAIQPYSILFGCLKNGLQQADDLQSKGNGDDPETCKQFSSIPCDGCGTARRPQYCTQQAWAAPLGQSFAVVLRLVRVPQPPSTAASSAL
jgi:hypothetical protein